MGTLQYENQILLDVIHGDELSIFAKGIAMERVSKKNTRAQWGKGISKNLNVKF